MQSNRGTVDGSWKRLSFPSCVSLQLAAWSRCSREEKWGFLSGKSVFVCVKRPAVSFFQVLTFRNRIDELQKQ